jgi:hypothetical protein
MEMLLAQVRQTTFDDMRQRSATMVLWIVQQRAEHAPMVQCFDGILAEGGSGRGAKRLVVRTAMED